MDQDSLSAARSRLDEYLSTGGRRKTPERYATLEAVAAMDGVFTLDELGTRMQKARFRVSRGTLYNSLRLFEQLRIVSTRRVGGKTIYEAAPDPTGRIRTVCSVCGRETEVSLPAATRVLSEARLKRFRKESFVVVFYGICSSCQARRRRNAKKT